MMDAGERARVFDAAERLFGERGFFRVSLDEVGAAAAVPLEQLASELPDSGALLVALARHLGHELRSTLHRAVEGLLSRTMMEGAGFDAWFRWVGEHPHVHRIVRQSELVDPEVYQQWYRDLASDYVRGLTRAMDEGEIRSLDPETLAWCLMGMGDFVAMRFVVWDGRETVPPDISRTFQRLVTKMLTESTRGR